MAQIMAQRANLVDAQYLKQIEAAHRDLQIVLTQKKQIAPTLLRLAFHDAGTYDARSNTGGPNGSIRNELNNAPNGGIKVALDFCEPVKQRHPGITYADLYQLAGVVAIEVTGGPKINFVPGRRDALHQRDNGNLPNPGGDSRHLRDIFHRMGLSDKDIVALSGAHTLGRAHRQVTGFDGPFTRQPLKFDNSYFVELMKGDTPGLVKFPTDKVLLQDPVFRQFVQLYARDERAFFKDYAESHKKMSELGFHPNQHQSHPTLNPHPQPKPHPTQTHPHPKPHPTQAHPHPKPHPTQAHPHPKPHPTQSHPHPKPHAAHQNHKPQQHQGAPLHCPAYGYATHC